MFIVKTKTAYFGAFYLIVKNACMEIHEIKLAWPYLIHNMC